MKTSAKYYHLMIWAQVQVKWAKVPKSPPLMTPLTKDLHYQPKKFFSLRTTRLGVF